MCGRYTLFVDRAELEERFDARFVSPAAARPRYNAAPGQRLPVITDAEPETIRTLEWGLVPAWADDSTGGLINARAETLAEKPSFRRAYEGWADGEEPTAGRCLVLADGFYEWVDTGGDGKQPYRVAFEDGRPFAMAGLWERWLPATTQTGLDAFGGGVGSDEGGDGTLETFTVVTTAPNALVADLHHRMAAMLEPADESGWLEGGVTSDALGPYAPAELRAYPVSTAVNDPTNDGPSLVEALE
ncbi:SOS response-associated peptidase [Natronobiforma cellulositropha]|uniref:SOS response-associated peptidase n=1 Tax=Natronobiforma cellulositropha TaxID=1679076 RepID=UPI0021D5E195|nr:SOS response-associated peptidase [Natronobiforma cellulositropha]